MAGIVINNLIKEENISCPRKPLDNSIFAEIQRAVRLSHLIDSNRSLLFDILTLACFIVPRVSEYAQTTHVKVDYHHVYPYGTQVIKAFTALFFIFYDFLEMCWLKSTRHPLIPTYW
jgi:hypothetical protein